MRSFSEQFFYRASPGTAISRSSRPEVICKKDVLRNFAKFIGKHLCQSLLFSKVAGLRPATLFKKGLWHRCFPVNFKKFLRTPFLKEHFSQSASRLLLPKSLWKSASTISFRKFLSTRWAESSVTCNLPVQLRFIEVNFLHVEYGIWRSLEYSFYQINWNSSFLAIISRLQEHPSLFALCFDMYFFIKKKEAVAQTCSVKKVFLEIS